MAVPALAQSSVDSHVLFTTVVGTVGCCEALWCFCIVNESQYTYSAHANLDPVTNVHCTWLLASQSCVHAPHRNIKVNNLATVHTIIVAHKFRSQNWSITAQCKTKRHHHGLARSRQHLVVERYFNVGCSCGVLRWRLHATYYSFQLTTQSTHGDAH